MKRIISTLLILATLIPQSIFAAPFLPWQGGLGIDDIPTFGQIPVGNGLGTYTLTATSSLGLTGSGTVNSSTMGFVGYYAGSGTTISGTSTIFIATSTNVGIGTTTPASKLTVYGDLILSGLNRYLNFDTSTSSAGYGFRDNGGSIQFKDEGKSWTNVSKVFHVDEYGADPTGLTDSLSAFESAITAANAVEAPIYLGKGEYLLSESIEIGKGIIGQGTGASTLVFSSSTLNGIEPVIPIIGTIGDSVIRDLSIEGTGAATSTGYGIYWAETDNDYFASNLDVERVKIIDFGGGIYTSNLPQFRLSQSQIAGVVNPIRMMKPDSANISGTYLSSRVDVFGATGYLGSATSTAIEILEGTGTPGGPGFNVNISTMEIGDVDHVLSVEGSTPVEMSSINMERIGTVVTPVDGDYVIKISESLAGYRFENFRVAGLPTGTANTSAFIWIDGSGGGAVPTVDFAGMGTASYPSAGTFAIITGTQRASVYPTIDEPTFPVQRMATRGGTPDTGYPTYLTQLIPGGTLRNVSIYGGFGTSLNLVSDTSGNQSIAFYQAGQNRWQLYSNSSNLTFYDDTNNRDHLQLTVSGASLLQGNFGVGTSTPRSKLAVTGTAGTGDIFTVASSTETPLLQVKSTGNVGIGTTSPSYKLAVSGDLNITGALRDNGSAGTSGYILQTTGSGIEWVSTSTLGLGGSSGTVSSVAMTVPTGLTVSGSPITTTGTLAVALDTGYVIPLTASTTDWQTAFSWGNHATQGYLTNINGESIQDLSDVANMTEVEGDLLYWNGSTWTNIATSSLGISGGSGSGTVNSGTQGQVAYYASTGTAVSGTSTLFLATTTNVGIGTTSPTTKLAVQGTFGVSATSTFTGPLRALGSVSQDATGIDRIDIGVEAGTPRMVFENAGSDIWQIDNHPTSGFRWFTPGVLHMALSSATGLSLPNTTSGVLSASGTGDSYFTGDLGIGVTSPSVKLHISGSSEVLRLEDSSATGNPFLSFFQTSTRRGYVQYLDTNDTLRVASEYGDVALYAASSAGSDSDTEYVRLKAGGNLGVGTASPLTQLSVGNVSTALGTTAMVGGGVSISTTSAITIGAENRSASSPSSGGAFGLFYSNDGAAMASGDRLGGLLFGGSSSASALRNTAGMVAYATQNWVDGSAYGSRLDFETTANGSAGRTTAMTITGDNKIGIGTTTPNADLMIGNSTSGGTTTPRVLSMGGTFGTGARGSYANGKFRLWDNGTTYFGIGMSASTMEYVTNTTNDSHVFLGGTTEAMRILNSRVGIATTSPTAMLTVSGTTTQATTDVFVVASSSNSQLLTVKPSGRVGIASSSPSHTFTVEGDQNLTGALRASGNAGTSGQILQSTGSGIQWVSTSTLALSAGILPSVTVTSTTHTAASTTPKILADDDTAGAGITITLPSSSSVSNGTIITVKKLGTTGNITIAIPSGDYLETTLDGSDVITTQFTVRNYMSNGNEWWIWD